MGQPLRREDPEQIFLITTRTIAERLWFVNNPRLDDRILAYLAKYAAQFGVILYAFVIMGNHYHMLARFPRANKAAFMRAFNSIFARLVGSTVVEFVDGHLWQRRYADQVVVNNEDVQHWFFYCALNPVSSGLTQVMSRYRSYNSFNQAASGFRTKHIVFERALYNEKRRYSRNVSAKDFMFEYELSFARLPGLEDLSASEYKKTLLARLESRRVELIEERLKDGRGFASDGALDGTKPGSRPENSKKSDRHTFRPLVLSLSKLAREEFINGYFAPLRAFRDASERYLAGDHTVRFPEGTYRPPCFVPLLSRENNSTLP